MATTTDATKDAASAGLPAGMRHVYTAAGTALGMLGLLHVLSADDIVKTKAAIDQIAGGFATLWTVLGPAVIAASGWFAVKSAGPLAQIKTLLSSRQGQQALQDSPGVIAAVAESPKVVAPIVTEPAIAAAAPSTKVIAP